jgi:hypothetical protein
MVFGARYILLQRIEICVSSPHTRSRIFVTFEYLEGVLQNIVRPTRIAIKQLAIFESLLQLRQVFVGNGYCWIFIIVGCHIFSMK